jgi:hypothetical protein
MYYSLFFSKLPQIMAPFEKNDQFDCIFFLSASPFAVSLPKLFSPFLYAANRFVIIFGVILLVSSSRIISLLPRSMRRKMRSNVEMSHNLRRVGSIRAKDATSPSTIVNASTLHQLLASPTKEKA